MRRPNRAVGPGRGRPPRGPRVADRPAAERVADNRRYHAHDVLFLAAAQRTAPDIRNLIVESADRRRAHLRIFVLEGLDFRSEAADGHQQSTLLNRRRPDDAGSLRSLRHFGQQVFRLRPCVGGPPPAHTRNFLPTTPSCTTSASTPASTVSSPLQLGANLLVSVPRRIDPVVILLQLAPFLVRDLGIAQVTARAGVGRAQAPRSDQDAECECCDRAADRLPCRSFPACGTRHTTRPSNRTCGSDAPACRTWPRDADGRTCRPCSRPASSGRYADCGNRCSECPCGTSCSG